MPLPADAQRALDEGIAALPLCINPTQRAQLERYLALLNQWNRVHNLTAIREPREQVIVHLLDCLAVLPELANDARTVVDVGSGAGLPAMVIAIMRTETQVYAVEANKKEDCFYASLCHAAQFAQPAYRGTAH
ncbi:class I SAM-dependent methyltransferase [Suttonella sp. R2A3]|uniref:16S rRNA (guanine(527)-N(7))-methyltransferase RsmG n=1 Tax=Suttonella sp. R2A3 TaxID=2908648 RepID=UPI001F01A9BD|nr:RsmG family class I SAM-dependent methyltransferase [Suttonella sp. R2A3]UJF23978.1 class I SAM-dependent methyltransferase [Suttonella sp. R2A3]